MISCPTWRDESKICLRQDEDEDWSRWRDVVFRAKGALKPVRHTPPRFPQNRPRRGNEEVSDNGDSSEDIAPSILTVAEAESTSAVDLNSTPTGAPKSTPGKPILLSSTILPDRLATLDITDPPPALSRPSHGEEMPYCPECYLPLHPDPNPTKLYIFLHALRYTTSLGSFETEMPEWAAPGWEWDRELS